MRASPFVVLTLGAVVVLIVVVVGGPWRRQLPASTEPAVHRDTGAGETAVPEHPFTDVTEPAGIQFFHVCDARGAYRLPEEMGSGGAMLDFDNDGLMDIYLVQGGEIGDAPSNRAGHEPTRGGSGRGAHRNRLYRNNGRGGFDDISAASGADVPGYGMGASAADYDDDGDVDLYVTRLGPNVLLRNNGDGTFTDVTDAAGVGDSSFSTAATFFDYDRDGRLDLFVVNYVDWSEAKERQCYDPGGARDYCSPTVYDAPTHDRLYHNEGDGIFKDVSIPVGLGSHRGNGLGVVATDLNGDGWVDLYVANDQTPAFLWINQGDGTFIEQAALAGAAFNSDGVAIAGMGVVAEDLDSDGDFDLLVANIKDAPHLALRNDGGSFEDVSRIRGLGSWDVPYTAFGVGLFDQDHDGVLDLFLANGAVNRLLEPLDPSNPYGERNQFARREADGRFRDASADAGPALAPAEMSRGAILGDYDNDGDIDILVTNNRGPARLLRNNAVGTAVDFSDEARSGTDAAQSAIEERGGGAWVMLDLVPRGGGRHALNARVELEAGRHAATHGGHRGGSEAEGTAVGRRGVAAEGGRAIHLREMRPHVGYLGSNDPRIHFGLGDADRIERLTVIWPDGAREAWNELPVKRHLRLRQGRAPEYEDGLAPFVPEPVP